MGTVPQRECSPDEHGVTVYPHLEVKVNMDHGVGLKGIGLISDIQWYELMTTCNIDGWTLAPVGSSEIGNLPVQLVRH